MKLRKRVLEPRRAETISVFQAGVGFIIVEDLEAYALFFTTSAGEIMVSLEDGNIALQMTPGKVCIYREDGLLKVRNDATENKNIGTWFQQYRYQ